MSVYQQLRMYNYDDALRDVCEFRNSDVNSMSVQRLVLLRHVY